MANIETKPFHFLRNGVITYVPYFLLLLPDGHPPTSNICFHIIRRGHIAQPLMLFLGHSVRSCICSPSGTVRGRDSSCGHFKMYFRHKQNTFTLSINGLFSLATWMESFAIYWIADVSKSSGKLAEEKLVLALQ